MSLYTTMTNLDARCSKVYDVPSVVLMENASRSVADAVRGQLYSKQTPVTVLCGPGNNGGDGWGTARHLVMAGCTDVKVVSLVATDTYTGDAACMVAMARHFNITNHADLDDVSVHLPDREGVVVDALWGTGLSRDVSGRAQHWVRVVNQWRTSAALGAPRCVLSVDIPSGISSKSGRMMGAAIHSDMTITFESMKLGHVLNEGKVKSGDVRVVPIGFPPAVFDDIPTPYQYVTRSMVSSGLPRLQPLAHKYSKGHVAVLAGSEGMTGAASLVCQSVMGSGCGVATWVGDSTLLPLLNLPPEVLTSTGNEDSLSERLNALKSLGSLVFGPGCGVTEDTFERVQTVVGFSLEHAVPLVIDADGLTLLARWYTQLNQEMTSWPRLSDITVLTPHVGESATLLGVTASDILDDLCGSAQNIQQRYGGVVLLKASTMVVADGSGQVWVNDSGNNTLATAGSGDVLAGLIASILAQQKNRKALNAQHAASMGAYVHGAIADALLESDSGGYGVTASVLIETLPRILEGLTRQ